MISAMKSSLQSLARRLTVQPRAAAQDERGFTAVEFAMVIGPFLALLFAIMEVALVYFAQFSLDNATDRAARLIRTGQAQLSGMGASAFKDEICKNVVGFIGCDSNLRVDVRSFPSFSSATPADPVDANGNFHAGFESFAMGNAGDVVLVSVYYKWGLMASWPRLGIGLGNLSSGERLITAATAFRNEPYNN
jgi:Flp pilus assembly protein TadG